MELEKRFLEGRRGPRGALGRVRGVKGAFEGIQNRAVMGLPKRYFNVHHS